MQIFLMKICNYQAQYYNEKSTQLESSATQTRQWKRIVHE